MGISFSYEYNIEKNRWEFIVIYENGEKSKYTALYLLNEKPESFLAGMQKVFRAIDEEMKKEIKL